LRKSRRPPKPSTKALEAVADKYGEEETSCKRRRDEETLRKSRRSPKPSTKALEAVVDKYEEEASHKRRHA
jgi:dephospho-CoA kinase